MGSALNGWETAPVSLKPGGACCLQFYIPWWSASVQILTDQHLDKTMKAVRHKVFFSWRGLQMDSRTIKHIVLSGGVDHESFRSAWFKPLPRLNGQPSRTPTGSAIRGRRNGSCLILVVSDTHSSQFSCQAGPSGRLLKNLFAFYLCSHAGFLVTRMKQRCIFRDV